MNIEQTSRSHKNREYYAERAKTAFDLRHGESPKTYPAIGLVMGVSQQTARNYVWKHKEALEAAANPEWDHGLSMRARNVLYLAGITSLERLRAVVVEGNLPSGRDPGYYYSGERFDIRSMRNYGKQTHNEILALLGIPVPSKGIRLCPHCGKPTNQEMK